MTCKSYPSDLTDAAWKVLHAALTPLLPRYANRKHSLRRICDALAYRLRTGCQWRYLPHDFPPHQTVYHYYADWTRRGVFDEVNALINRHSRWTSPRHDGSPTEIQPAAAVVDSQAVKSATRGRRDSLGFAGDKRVNGVKRHVLTDTGGRVLSVVVTPANRHDGPVARECVIAARAAGYDSLRVVYADSGYRGQEGKCAREGVDLRVVTRDEITASKRRRNRLKDKTFAPLPKRWVIERTFGILSQWRAIRISHERRDDHVASSYLLVNSISLLNRL